MAWLSDWRATTGMGARSLAGRGRRAKTAEHGGARWRLQADLADSAKKRVLSIGIHKCTGADGKVSYQQQPSTAAQRADKLILEGEIDPDRRAEAEAIAETHQLPPAPMTPEKRAELARRLGIPQLPAPPTAAPRVARTKVKCPDPYGKYFTEPSTPSIIGYESIRPGHGSTPAEQRPIDGTPPNLKYRNHPGKAYLKNAGRWPEGRED